MEKRLQYIAEDINALLDKTEIAVDTEADRELMTNTPIARAGGLGRVVYVKATKKSYQYNIDTGEWVALPTSGVEIDAEISNTSENPVQNKVISGALDKKQDTLTAGENITIQNNVISVDGKIAKYFTGTNIELYNKIASGEFKIGDFVWLDNVMKDPSITDITDTKLVDGKVLMQIVDGPHNYKKSVPMIKAYFEFRKCYTVILYNVKFKVVESSYGTGSYLKSVTSTDEFSIYKTYFTKDANPNSKVQTVSAYYWFVSVSALSGLPLINAPANERLDAVTSVLKNNEKAVTSDAVYTALEKKQNTLTTSQLEAVNSGATTTKINQIATNTTNIASLQTGKQDKLTAGAGITIQDNVISAKTSQPIYKHKLLINVTIGTYATTATYNYLSNSSEVITDFALVDDDFNIGASNALADNLVKVFGIRVTKVGNVVTVKGTDSTFAELTGSATLGNDVVSQL